MEVIGRRMMMNWMKGRVQIATQNKNKLNLQFRKDTAGHYENIQLAEYFIIRGDCVFYYIKNCGYDDSMVVYQ